MLNLVRLRAIPWRTSLTHSQLRPPLTQFSLSKPRSYTSPSPLPSTHQPIIRQLAQSNRPYSTTTANNPNPESQQSQHEPPPPPPESHWLGHPLRLLLTSLKLLALFHLCWEHLFSLAPAQGPSMLATYPITGTWHLTSRLHRLGRNLHVGDIVTFTLPDRPSSVGVKRVIGLPGDYVLLGTPGEFWHSGADPRADDALMLQVPQGHAYLVGDNLPASNDSRIFGPVPLGLVRSKVIASMEPSFERGPFAGFYWVGNPMQRDQPPTREEVVNARLGGGR